MSSSPDAFPTRQTLLIEWRRAHLESSPRTPSSVVKDIDPVVETAILRCLQKDPALRPSSVRQVAAAFPGGDPLAAALAAGETPSPEMVAASGETEGLRPAVAWVLLAGVIVGVTVAILLSAQTMLYRRVPLKNRQRRLPNARGIFCKASATPSRRQTRRWGSTKGTRLCATSSNTTSQRRVGQPRYRGVRVLVSRQPPAACDFEHVLGCTRIGNRMERRPAGRQVRDDVGPSSIRSVVLLSSSKFPRRLTKRQARRLHLTGRRCSLPQDLISPSGSQRSRCGRLRFIAMRALHGQDRWRSAPISRCGSRLRRTGASLSTSS